MTPDGDILMACVKSGSVVLVEGIHPEIFDKDLTPGVVRAIIGERGAAVRIRGRACGKCSHHNEAACEYRPLRGPLFVPR